MASILNDAMLKRLICSECDKYMSSLPIKVYPNRKIKCARCWEENDGGVVSLCNIVIKNCLFKCINRYEGCNKLLTVSEVKTHEQQCFSGTHYCPKCEYKFSGSAYELLFHYTKQHPTSILKNSTFTVDVKRQFRERYLYVVEDRIFVVLVENLSHEKVLYLSVAVLSQCKNVTYNFSIRPLKRFAINIVTEKKPCLLLENFDCDYFSLSTNSRPLNCKVFLDLSHDINVVDQVLGFPKDSSTSADTQTIEKDFIELNAAATQSAHIQYTSTGMQSIPLEKVFGVKLTDQFRQLHPGYELTPCGTALFKDRDRIELACSNCRQLTGCNVFNCELNRHIICWDCKAWCGICNTRTNGWDSTLSSINELLLLPCKWQCGLYFSGGDIREHELYCEKVLRECPKCIHSNRQFGLKALCNHLIAFHYNYKDIIQFNLSGYFKQCHEKTSDTVYFFQNGYFFKMSWFKTHNAYEVSILPVDDINCFEIAVICDTQDKYNKSSLNKFSFVATDNPRLYLRRLRNL